MDKGGAQTRAAPVGDGNGKCPHGPLVWGTLPQPEGEEVQLRVGCGGPGCPSPAASPQPAAP